jgi:coenzyme F420 hydrogenase subunit beta
MSPFEKLMNEVIDPGLCTRCGACVGLCPDQNLTFIDPLGECLPALQKEFDCSECNTDCGVGCPGEGINFPKLNEFIFGSPPPDYLLGHADSFNIGWATDNKIRSRGSSGGVVTAILNDMLIRGDIQGAVCLIDDPENPFSPKPVIATDLKTLFLAQQSKYSIAPINQILNQVDSFKGSLAFVGLPHQVHSIRKLQAAGNPIVRKIKVILGSYCGLEQHFTAVVDFLSVHGVKNLSQVRKLEYRAGNWPGKFRITLKSGKLIELEKFYANYMSLFYAVERSLLCLDLTNELADISFGDAWAKHLESKKEGYSLVVARTKNGGKILQDCSASGSIALESSSRSKAMEMHAHGLYNKKIAVWGRINLRKWLKQKSPKYGYIVEISLKQKFAGLFIALTFLVCRTRLARGLVGMVYPKIIGVLFLWVRKIWRKALSNQKKMELRDWFRVKID